MLLALRKCMRGYTTVVRLGFSSPTCRLVVVASNSTVCLPLAVAMVTVRSSL